MKRALSFLVSVFLVFSTVPSALAEETEADMRGIYVNSEGEVLAGGLRTMVSGSVRYMPAAEVLRGLGLGVVEDEETLTLDGVTLTAGSHRVKSGDDVRIASVVPKKESGVLYAPEKLVSEVFGVKLTEQKDGSIKVQQNKEEDTEIVDDSWYDEYIANKKEEPEEELTVSQRLRKNFQRDLYSSDDISNLLNAMNDYGEFTDLDYKDTNLTSWQPGSHVSRLGKMAKAIYNPENKFYMNEEGLRKLELGIKYWFDNNFVSQNWWWNDRGVPDYFMEVAAFDPDIDEKYKRKLDEITKNQPGGSFRFVENPSNTTIRPWAGAEAGVPFQTAVNEMIALRLPDEVVGPWLEDIIKAINIEFTDMPYPLNFNTTGLSNDTDQHMRGDYSYTCHTYQLLINTYGTGLMQRGPQKMLRYTEGMGLKLSDEAAEEIAAFIVDGWRWFGYRNHMQNTTIGRGAGQSGHDYKYAGYVKEMYKELAWRFLYEYPNVTRKAELLWVINSLNDPENNENFTGNRYFWQTDFLSHNRANYQFGVHPVSERSTKPESVLNINCLGLYLGDGAYNLLKRGGEYNGLQPIMDWNRIPGVTAELGQSNLSPSSGSHYGTTSFVGGVSDGLYGASVFDYNFRGVSAKKSWFCFDDEIVCLGAGVTGKGNGDIYTTVNQINLYGDVKTDKSGVLDEGVHDESGSRWVLHDGTGYVFSGDETINVENQTRTGNYKRIDLDSGSEKEVSGDVFIIGINHGKKPVDGTYAYTILPETDEEQIKRYAQNRPFEIVSNTKDIQAVYHKDLKILQAGFYTAGSVSGGGITVTVDKPCALMVRQTGKDYEVCVSNPYNVAAKINVNLSGAVSANLAFDLTEGYRGNDAGRTMVYDSAADSFKFADNKELAGSIETPAELLAVMVDGEVMESFKSRKFIYTLNVSEIPEIKAKGNFPVKIENRENETKITVTDPDNPNNTISYFIKYNFI